MPDNPHDLQHDIALLERAIERCAETLASGFFRATEFHAICEEMAILERYVAAMNRLLELAR